MLRRMTKLTFKCLILTVILVGIGVTFFIVDYERRNINLNSDNIKILLSETEWTKNNIELTIKYNKVSNHIKEYSFDNGKTWTKSNILALNKNEDLTIKIKDINEKIYSIDYSVNNIDKSGPIILTDSNIQVGLNSKVNLVDYVTVYDDGVGLRDEIVFTPATIDTSKVGTHTVQIYAIDKLANKTISKMNIQVVNTNVNVDAKLITLDKIFVSLVPGKEEQLITSVGPKATTNKNIIWKSSDANIATIDNTGKVTGISQGHAVITATTTNGIKDNCLVIVN